MTFLAAANANAESEVWEVLFQLLALLGASLVIGMLFERFRQPAILGYLIAGMLLGPQGFGVVSRDSGVPVIAELGISLLLFAIGLEFSARRLIRLGPIAGLGGSLQVITTLALATGAGLLVGVDLKAALCLGAAIALSSTACVLRLLTDRAELDSVHGRASLGILLLQDIAVVPLVLFVTMLTGGGGIAGMFTGLAKALGLILALVAGFRLLAGWVIPPLMKQLSLSRDRELLVLLAVVLAIGSALAAHSLALSPALGAFIAGMMLAESPFATQIRADVGGLRILFITLFFASVGMLGDPAWIVAHLPSVIG
jgi:CPA2 family monovalent cation:H+ antiporter-2